VKFAPECFARRQASFLFYAVFSEAELPTMRKPAQGEVSSAVRIAHIPLLLAANGSLSDSPK
jgi:hypothetical protein